MASKVERTLQGVVILDYSDLVGHKDLTTSIEEAYGYDGIGLLVVKGVPTFEQKRKALLPLAAKYAALPTHILDKTTHKESNYSIGWSHGKEILQPGQYDTYKGSYYANPQYDIPTTDVKLIEEFPESCLPNIWPKEDFPALELAFKDLGQLIVEVGLLVAVQCDNYARAKSPSYPPTLLQEVIKHSRIAKGRLLHYFPIKEDTKRTRDSWCGWHNDHGSLNGLCPAMFLRDGDFDNEIDSPDKEAGLYVKTRAGVELKVVMPRDCLAFQIGETSQIQSGGLLRATPHAVQAIVYPQSKDVNRNTFAVFMEPNFDVILTPPEGKTIADTAVARYTHPMNFGEFSKITIAGYYKKD